jgi:hypothetical protein
MVINSKDKGKRWEREAAKILNKSFPNVWTRIPLSGALGTVLEMPSLKADLIGEYYFLKNPIMAEAKYGYGGSSMTIKKEWFDKIRIAAEETYSLPVVLLKFDNARSGVRYVIALDFEAWDELMSDVERMHTELLNFYEEFENERSS